MWDDITPGVDEPSLRVVSGRIRVTCEMNPQFDGYVAELGGSMKMRVIVTGNILEAKIYQRALKTTFPNRVGEITYVRHLFLHTKLTASRIRSSPRV